MDIVLSKSEQNVYEMLTDECSRNVFLKRKKYAEDTGESFSYTDHTYSFIDVFDKPKNFEATIELLRSKPYVLYGFGYRGKSIFDVLKLCDCVKNCVGIWDNNSDMQGKVFNGIVVAPPPTNISGDMLIVISVSERVPSFGEIKRELLQRGVSDKGIVCPYYALYNFEHMYFDEEIVLSRLTENEIFVDGGCCDFFNSKQLLKLSPNIMKIYAVEPNPAQHNGIIRAIEKSGFNNVKLIKNALWSHSDTLHFKTEFSGDTPGTTMIVNEETSMDVDAVALDEIVPNTEKITFIKLDLEGSEMEALHGAEHIIKRDKPKLAICIYHKPDDYIEIPSYIKSIVPDYKIYMRQYKPFCDDTVLYAVI